jgi:O-acetylhomoserine/O-acetylserine sulfhydrylase-like pyridoxal-dependent enzyme
VAAGPKYPGFDTLALHAGQSPDATTGARAVPIYATTSYVFRDSEHAASLFNMERAGHVYSRISNPTVAVLEERMAALEGGVGAIATASGQAALHLAVATLMDAGSHIVASNSLYGGSHNLLGYTMKRFGIETTFVAPGTAENFRKAIRPNTRLLFGETLGNPGLEVLDIPAVSQVAHDAGLPLLIDATFTTPYLMQPFAHGATCCTTRPPSSSAGTAWPSAACSSTRGASTGRRAANSRSSPRPTRVFTTWISRKSRARARSCCARGARACGTLAPAWRR